MAFHAAAACLLGERNLVLQHLVQVALDAHAPVQRARIVLALVLGTPRPWAQSLLQHLAQPQVQLFPVAAPACRQMQWLAG